MRGAALILAMTFMCATSAAFAQARVLTMPAEVPLQSQEQAPQAPANDAAPAVGEELAPPVRAQATSPAPAEEPSQNQTSNKVPDTDTADQEPPGRFSFQRVHEGLLRLDHSAGEVAFCRPNTTGWVCEAVPQDGASLEKEINQLRGEVAALKKEIASLRQPPPPVAQPVPPPRDPGKTVDTQVKLPTAEDIARARAFIADTWHRLVEMIENWQKDVLRKT